MKMFALAATLVVIGTGATRAQDNAGFSADGIRVSFPNWQLINSQPGDIPVLFEIEPVLRESPVRNCRLDRQALPPASGMTQELVNQRMLGAAGDAYANSPTYRQIGVVDDVTTALVDGVAVIDVTMRGQTETQPDWMRDRTFAFVNLSGEGTYHRFSCVIFGAASAAQMGEVNAILDSLRFHR